MTTKKLSRKQFLMLAGSSVAAGALAACAAASPRRPRRRPPPHPRQNRPRLQRCRCCAHRSTGRQSPDHVSTSWPGATRPTVPPGKKLVPAYQAKYPARR